MDEHQRNDTNGTYAVAHARIDDAVRRAAERYARGELAGDELARYREHLLACAVCRDVLESEPLVLATMSRFVGEAPPPRAWERIRERMRESAAGEGAAQPWKQWTTPAPPASGDDSAAWEATSHPGVRARCLSLDRSAKRVTMLVQMDAGASYPAHRHGGAEECFVVSGDLRIGPLHLRAGEFQRVEEGSVHPPQSTDEGCLLLISSSLADEIL